MSKDNFKIEKNFEENIASIYVRNNTTEKQIICIKIFNPGITPGVSKYEMEYRISGPKVLTFFETNFYAPDSFCQFLHAKIDDNLDFGKIINILIDVLNGKFSGFLSFENSGGELSFPCSEGGELSKV